MAVHPPVFAVVLHDQISCSSGRILGGQSGQLSAGFLSEHVEYTVSGI